MPKKQELTEAPESEAINKFEELRRRVIESGKIQTVKTTDEPFILGADWGFTTPIKVEKPKFTASELISESLRTGQVLQALRLVFGPNISKVLPKIDALGDEGGPSSILLIEDIMVHFYGPGAAQVFTN